MTELRRKYQVTKLEIQPDNADSSSNNSDKMSVGDG